MGLRKERSQVKQNYIAFYATDGMKNWIEDSRGFEKRSSFIHRTLERVRKLELENRD